ncbi:hypothetical protein HK101_010043 [Irineochytrium annulatum]|nr:hypothetical protein HK101_010043 [Irineochytrium annulatum]
MSLKSKNTEPPRRRCASWAWRCAIVLPLLLTAAFALLPILLLAVIHLPTDHFSDVPIPPPRVDPIDALYTSVTENLHEGHPSHHWRSIPQSDPPPAPLGAVLLLHGFPESGRLSWRHQMPALAGAGYDVIVPDLRGFNGSAGGSLTARDSHSDGMLLDLEVLLSRTIWADDDDDDGESGAASRGRRSRRMRRRLCVVGHDWGAVPAWDIALRHPDDLACLVILNGPHGGVYMRHLKREPVLTLKHAWYVVWFLIMGEWADAVIGYARYEVLERFALGSSTKGAFSKEDAMAYRELWGRPGVMKTMLGWYQYVKERLAGNRIDVPPPSVETIPSDIPVVTIWGKRDAYLPLAIGTDAKGLLAPHMEFHFFENGTHWVQHDHRDEVNAILLDTLKGARW